MNTIFHGCRDFLKTCPPKIEMFCWAFKVNKEEWSPRAEITSLFSFGQNEKEGGRHDTVCSCVAITKLVLAEANKKEQNSKKEK